MKVLFDTDVVLDVLLDREPFSETATLLLDCVAKQECRGLLCATTLTNIFYIARKAIGIPAAKDEIRKLLFLFDVAPVNKPVLQAAVDSGFTDFEDAVLHESAFLSSAEAITTRNLEDFRPAKILVYSPDQLLSLLQEKAGE